MTLIKELFMWFGDKKAIYNLEKIVKFYKEDDNNIILVEAISEIKHTLEYPDIDMRDTAFRTLMKPILKDIYGSQTQG